MDFFGVRIWIPEGVPREDTGTSTLKSHSRGKAKKKPDPRPHMTCHTAKQSPKFGNGSPSLSEYRPYFLQMVVLCVLLVCFNSSNSMDPPPYVKAGIFFSPMKS